MRRAVLQSVVALVVLFGTVLLAPAMASAAAGHSDSHSGQTAAPVADPAAAAASEHSTHSTGEHEAAVAAEGTSGAAGEDGAAGHEAAGHEEGGAAGENGAAATDEHSEGAAGAGDDHGAAATGEPDNSWVFGANIAAAIAVLLFLGARGRRREAIPGASARAKSAAAAVDSDAAPVKLTILDRIFKSSLYPVVPQAGVIGIFVYILFALLFGPSNPSDNFGSVMVWIMWWPVIPISFVLAGRFWCSLCPWGAISDWLQTHFSLGLKVPKIIKNYGIWVIFGGFMFITWYELAFGLTASATATVTVLLVVAVLALATSMLFERRVWCRYLCPLGGIFGNYSQTATVEFRGTPEICATCTKHGCYKGAEAAPGCPLFEFPKTMESNRLCNLCGNCVKNCENGSPKLKWRMPGKELWEKRDGRLDEAVLASVLVGVILMAGFGMLEFWQAWVAATSTSTGIPEWIIVSIAYLLAAFGGLGLSILASALSARGTGEGTWANLIRYGYALIPLNLATHSAHNMFHFLGEGKTIGGVILKLVGVTPALASVDEAAAAAGGHHGGIAVALMSPAGIRMVQFVLMGLGIAASILVAWRIAKSGAIRREAAAAELDADAADAVDVSTVKASMWRSFAPQLVVISIFSFVSFMLYVLPMASRH